MAKIIQNELLVDAVYDRIKQDILDSKYAGGEKLTVRELCENYGVSETPVKQALNRLVSEGLVENIPRKGMQVRKFYFETFKQTMESRNMIEQYAVDAAIAMLKRDDKYKEELTTALKENIDAFQLYMQTKDESDYNKSRKLDLKFHEIIVRASQNQYIINGHKDLIVHERMFFMCNAGIKVRMAAVIEEHNGIFNALINGDRNAAKEAIDRHLYKSVADHKMVFNEFKEI